MTQRVRVVAAVIERDGKVLVCRRPALKRHGGLWEFPGGKIEPDEDDLAALRRELREELAVEVVSVAEEVFRNDDGGFSIAFIPTVIAGEPEPVEHEAILWALPADLARLELAPSDLLFVRSKGSALR
jgi:8-oxo-dGTP diphosphatase